MPAFAFWNTYRLGGGSGSNKKLIIEGVLAQLFHDNAAVDFAVLCEVTGDVQLGDAQVGKNLYKASRKSGQLAYSAFDNDMAAHNLELAGIDDFQDVFGTNLIKKGGGKFSKQSKRPVAYAGQAGNTHVYIYHANATSKAGFLVSWVAESLNQETGGQFILAGDLNCQPVDFNTWIDTCTGQHNYNLHFSKPNGGHTHNAKAGLVKTYDWAVVGPNAPATTVTAFNFSGVIGNMGFTDDPRSDHLPIVVSW